MTGDGSTLGDDESSSTASCSSHLQKLGENENATNKQRVIAESSDNKDRTVLASETNLEDALDRVHAFSRQRSARQHMFPMPQALEACCQALASKKNDGGQFFTPREAIRVIVNTVDPQLGRAAYDLARGRAAF